MTNIAQAFESDDSRFFCTFDKNELGGGLHDPLDKDMKAAALRDVMRRFDMATARHDGDFNAALSSVLHELYTAAIFWSVWQSRSDTATWIRAAYARDHELAMLLDRSIDEQRKLEGEVRELRARVGDLEAKRVDAV